ncbi:MAG: hypothetical protein V4581_11990 [Bacteroidota bacterium]
MKTFLRQNYISFLIGACFFAVYLFFTFSGNRLCGCAPAEKYKPTSGSGAHRGYYGGANRFYHK